MQDYPSRRRRRARISARRDSAQTHERRGVGSQRTLVGEARHHPITFSAGGFGYIFAGISGKFDMWKFDPSTRKTKRIEPATETKPAWRTMLSYGIAIGTTAYLGFGISDGQPLRDWWKYDTTTNEFEQLASLPSDGIERWHPAIVPVEVDGQDGKEWLIIVSCGSSRSGNLKDTWEYSVKDAWTKRPDLPGPARHHPYYFDAKTSAGKHLAYVGFGRCWRGRVHQTRSLQL